MKKSVKFLMLAVMFVTLLTGCQMKEQFSMKITSDKELNYELIIAMDEEFINGMLSMKNGMSSLSALDEEDSSDADEYTSEDQWKYLEETILSNNKVKNGLKYRKYEEEKFKGYIFTIISGNLDDYTKDSDSRVDIISLTNSGDFSDAVLFTKSGEKYISNMKYDITKDDSYNELSSSGYMSTGDMFKAELTISLPNKAISNNASEVSKDGKTLTWDLVNKSGDIELKFNLSKSSNTIIYVVAGVACVVVAGALIVLTKKKNTQPVA